MEKEQNLGSYKILYKGGSALVEEKKSKFIATLRPVQNEEEATAFLEEIKKKYWDARHNCFACVIGKNAQLTRCNDDGEPSGTAGRPMLEVLLREEICNIAVVVTRYFGGTLLGTGGLVRAYSKAVKEGILASEIAFMYHGVLLAIETDYNYIGKIQYLLAQNEITPEQAEYTQNVSLTVRIPLLKAELLKKEITEVTKAQATIIELERGFYIDKQ